MDKCNMKKTLLTRTHTLLYIDSYIFNSYINSNCETNYTFVNTFEQDHIDRVVKPK